jgi:hypothetical protein
VRPGLICAACGGVTPHTGLCISVQIQSSLEFRTMQNLYFKVMHCAEYKALAVFQLKKLTKTEKYKDYFLVLLENIMLDYIYILMRIL